MGAILAMAILDRGWTRVPAGLAALVGGFHLWMAAPSARQALTEAGCEPELGLLLSSPAERRWYSLAGRAS